MKSIPNHYCRICLFFSRTSNYYQVFLIVVVAVVVTVVVLVAVAAAAGTSSMSTHHLEIAKFSLIGHLFKYNTVKSRITNNLTIPSFH